MTLRVHSLAGGNFVEYPGHCSLVVNTSGCHIACPFCFNRDLWDPATATLGWGDVEAELIRGRHFIEAVAWTGADPLEQPSLPQYLERVKARGLRNALYATPTHVSRLRACLSLGLLDYVHLSLKGSDVPVATEKRQRETLACLAGSGVDTAFEFVYTRSTKHEAPRLEAMVHDYFPGAEVKLTRAINPDYLRGDTI